ncbi:MAG: Gfo/Idh/MocA family oxidoreductase [Candidatus Brocadiia bacterium]|nr:Gfo/Idh/MocA family oxidoreductase [Candidatus Brocadiia bacterium]
MAVGWGVIGAGGIAMRRTIPEGIMAAPNAELAAVMGPHEQRVREVSEKFGGVPHFTSEEELLAHPDVQAVYIATPTNVHAAQCLASIKAGKHVLVEKPVAMSVKEAQEVSAAAAKKGVTLGAGFMMRHHGAHRRLAQMAASDAFGKLVMGRAQLSCWYPPMDGAWRQDPEVGGGGSFIDMGNHCVDLLETFLGKTSEVSAFSANLVHDYRSEDSAAVILRFESGALGLVDTFFNIPDAASKNVLELYGLKGSARCEGTIGQDPDGTVTLRISEQVGGYDAQQVRAGAQERELEYEKVNTYRAEIEDFSEAIARDREPAVPYDDGIWSMRVCEAVYRSAREGRAVKVQ